MLESNSSAGYLSSEASQSDRKHYDPKDEKETLIKVLFFSEKK